MSRFMRFIDKAFRIIGVVSRYWVILGASLIIGLSMGYCIGMAFSLPKQYAQQILFSFLYGAFYAIGVNVLVTMLLERRGDP